MTMAFCWVRRTPSLLNTNCVRSSACTIQVLFVVQDLLGLSLNTVILINAITDFTIFVFNGTHTFYYSISFHNLNRKPIH